MAKVLGYWRCDYCDSGDKIPGNVRNCPRCGRPVGENVKYEFDSSIERVVVPENIVPKGPDWKCDYCSSYNRFEESICKNCGAPREKESLNYFENLDKKDTKDVEKSIKDKRDMIDYLETNLTDTQERKYEPKNVSYDDRSYNDHYDKSYHTYSGESKNFFSDFASKCNLKIVLVIFLIILSIIGITMLLIPKEKEMVVEGFSWERIMYIEKYQTFQESDWNLPSGARSRYAQNEITYYTDVFAGYEESKYTVTELDHIESSVVSHKDLGNGYFDEIIETEKVYRSIEKTTMVEKYNEEPVYDTMYYYDTDKFAYNRSIVTKANDKNPYWGEGPLESNIPKIGDERVSSREEKYMIYGTVCDGNQKTKQYTLDFSSWNNLNEGDVIKCKIYITGKIEIIE